tara:strand:- start:604 stop:855 length:252 start_codon:yes stop_codon:yes gene_type:complete
MILDISLTHKKRAFEEALKITRQGDSILYHTGSYAGGKHKTAALEAAKKGLVALVQKKKGEGIFQYLAQRSKKRFKNSKGITQ